MSTNILPEYNDNEQYVNGILNGSNPDSPYNWIKTKGEAGIIENSFDISQNLQNMNIYNEYSNALLKNNSNILKNTNDIKSLGKRYFSKSDKRCITAPDGNFVDQYFVVDNILDYNGEGLLHKALNNLSNVSKDNINKYYTPNSNNSITLSSDANLDENLCKKVKLVIDNNGNTDTNYISKYEYDKLKNYTPTANIVSEAFHNMHTVNGYGYDHRTNYSNFNNNEDKTYKNTPLFIYNKDKLNNFIINEDGYILYDLSETENETENVSNNLENNYIDNITSMNSIDSIYTSDESLEDNSYIWDANNPEELEQIRNHHFPYNVKKRHNNIISNFFLGSITVLGLYIVFRFLDKSASSIRR